MNRLTVTAVIPAFNAGRYLADAIKSVLNQTYDRLDCLVVDDGSTDETADIAASFPSVRLIRKSNEGVARTRNLGIAEARGDLVAFLDADDVWTSEKLAKQVRCFERDPDLGLVYSGLQVVNEVLEPVVELHAPSGIDALRNSLCMEPPVMSLAQTGVAPKQVLESLGGFDERMSTSADTDLACRIAATNRVRGIDEALVLYRQHSAQMHLNADAMEHDMELLFEKMFSKDANPALRGLERRARANLQTTLALSGMHEHAYGHAVSRLVHALRLDPAAAARMMRRALAQRR